MSVRALARPPVSVDVATRSFSFVASTETPVRTWISDPSGKRDEHGCVRFIEVDEVLSMDGVDFGRAVGMPLVDAHNTFSIDAQLGSIDALEVETVERLGRALTGSARFVPSRGALAEAMAEGHYRQLSVGYFVRHHDVQMRDGDVPLAVATDWELQEISLCPVGADRHAQVRSAPALFPLPTATVRAASRQDSPMDFEAQIVAAEAALTAADEAVAALPAEAPAGTDAALSQRAAAVRLRSLRAEPAATKKDSDGKAEGDETGAKEETAEDKAERTAAAAVRSIAASYGADVAKTVDDLVALGTRSSDIRTAVRSAVLARSAATPATVVQPAPQTRSAGASTLSHRDVFSNMNGAFKR